MITLTLSPIRDDRRLTVTVAGATLILNGTPVDLDGYDPETAPCDWIVGPVERIGADHNLTLLAPYGPDAPPEALWPVPVTVTEDGPVTLPGAELTTDAVSG